uniref:Uncharacterized protein n=1 Tax=Megaselia scalaris TaxID=36166 RepID=T1GLI9_MEGSC
MFDNKRWKTKLKVVPTGFRSSAGMLSLPMPLLFLSLWICLSTSVLDGGAHHLGVVRGDVDTPTFLFQLRISILIQVDVLNSKGFPTLTIPFNFLIKFFPCLSKVSIYCSRILKWKARVMIFLLLNHFLPLLTSNPSFSHGSKSLYFSALSLNLLPPRINSTSLRSLVKMLNSGPIQTYNILIVLTFLGFQLIRNKSRCKSPPNTNYQQCLKKNVIIPIVKFQTRQVQWHPSPQSLPTITKSPDIICLSVHLLNTLIGDSTLLPNIFKLSSTGVTEAFLASSSSISAHSISKCPGNQQSLSELTLLSSFSDSSHVSTTPEDILKMHAMPPDYQYGSLCYSYLRRLYIAL